MNVGFASIKKIYETMVSEGRPVTREFLDEKTGYSRSVTLGALFALRQHGIVERIPSGTRAAPTHRILRTATDEELFSARSINVICSKNDDLDGLIGMKRDDVKFWTNSLAGRKFEDARLK